MRRPLLATFIALFCTAFILGGCRSRVNTVTAQGESAIALDTNSKRTTHTAKYANRITLTLPPADLAQHRWEISFHDARFLKQLTEFQPPKNPDEGATIAFLTTRTGTTRIRFVLLPVGNAREATPTDGRDLVLTIE